MLEPSELKLAADAVVAYKASAGWAARFLTARGGYSHVDGVAASRRRAPASAGISNRQDEPRPMPPHCRWAGVARQHL